MNAVSIPGSEQLEVLSPSCIEIVPLDIHDKAILLHLTNDQFGAILLSRSISVGHLRRTQNALPVVAIPAYSSSLFQKGTLSHTGGFRFSEKASSLLKGSYFTFMAEWAEWKTNDVGFPNFPLGLEHRDLKLGIHEEERLINLSQQLVCIPLILVEKLSKTFTDVSKFVLRQGSKSQSFTHSSPPPPHAGFPVLLSS
ncbi:hypothetical protein AVEN_53769-1 [Araneus ventricosus]|uniref:Uncharacterized protein n=1 Tax=Araneus ventricosus TaxID=182803 RepID=A0A4Y2V522_ARAVE|nr:hypothetical protein AVEN_53769-1 [Araneus ventricosus]